MMQSYTCDYCSTKFETDPKNRKAAKVFCSRDCSNKWGRISAGWTPQQEAELKRLWTDGQTAGYIANVLGVTRNAVMGKVHRQGLSSGAKPTSRKQRPYKPRVASERQPKRKRPTVAKVRLPAVQKEPPKAERLDLMALTELTCKWPIGDPQDEDFCFCGVRIEPTGAQPYCSYHKDLGTVQYRRRTEWSPERRAAARRVQNTLHGMSGKYLEASE